MLLLASLAVTIGFALLAFYGYGKLLEHQNDARDRARAEEWKQAEAPLRPETGNR